LVLLIAWWTGSAMKTSFCMGRRRRKPRRGVGAAEPRKSPERLSCHTATFLMRPVLNSTRSFKKWKMNPLSLSLVSVFHVHFVSLCWIWYWSWCFSFHFVSCVSSLTSPPFPLCFFCDSQEALQTGLGSSLLASQEGLKLFDSL